MEKYFKNFIIFFFFFWLSATKIAGQGVANFRSLYNKIAMRGTSQRRFMTKSFSKRMIILVLDVLLCFKIAL